MKIVFFISLIFIQFGCTTTPTYKLAPTGSHEWKNGVAYLENKNENIHVNVGFVRRDAKGYVFSVNISNLSQSSVDINPMNIICSRRVVAGEQKYEKPVRDPEYMYNTYNKSLERDQKSKSGGMAFLDLVVSISDIVERDPKKIAENEKRQKEEDEDERDKQRRIVENTDKRKYWGNIALRRNTLHPNKSVFGDVICPTYIVGENGIDLTFSFGTSKNSFSWLSISSI